VARVRGLPGASRQQIDDTVGGLLTVLEKGPNRTNPTGQINGWKAILNTLAITYGDRLNLN
jgi:hypothetical protein